MLGIAIAAGAIVPRLLGGFAVLRHRDRVHLWMGLAGGALIGVAFFETMPEALELGRNGPVLAVAAVGTLAFAVLERSVFGHLHTQDAVCSPRAGHVGAGAITTHAFIDGLAIGTAFQAGTSVGLLVSVAVLLHAFSDGLNTVAIILRHGHSRRRAIAWLAADATAPVLGASLGLFVAMPDPVLASLLAFFAGMFLYMGAGSLLPEAHRAGRDRLLVVAAAAFGIALALTAAQLA
jgi:zinc transporter ZupT